MKKVFKRLGILQHFDSPVVLNKGFDNLPIERPFAEWVDDAVAGCQVLHINDFSTVLQAIDKARFLSSKTGMMSRIYLRGQNRFSLGRIRPSLYRSAKLRCPRKSFDAQIIREIAAARKASPGVLNAASDAVWEGVFQQYGLHSRWVDAVDNVWVALWFACHSYWPEHVRGEICTYIRRNPMQERAENPYAYILLLGGRSTNETKIAPGHWRYDRMEVVDLRYALPSQYLRPHMQHGVLLRSLTRTGEIGLDFGKLIQGVIRVDLKNALAWLGTGSSFDVRNIFPGPMFDTGYRELIEDIATAGMRLPIVSA